MKIKNTMVLLFSSAVLGSTLMVTNPQVNPVIHADQAVSTVANTTLPDGHYVVPVRYQKENTNEQSTMTQYMGTQVTIDIVNGQAKLTIPAKNKTTADMLTKFTVSGKTAVRQGNNFVVTGIPANSLSKVIKGHVDVEVPGVIKESQPVDIQLTLPKPPAQKPAPDQNKSAEDAAKKQSEAEQRAADAKAKSEAEQKAADAKAKSEAEKKAADAKAKAESEKKAADAKAKSESTKKQNSKKQSSKKSTSQKKQSSKKNTSKKSTSNKSQSKKTNSKKSTSNKVKEVTYTARYVKSGTSTTSTMNQYMKPSATMYQRNGDQYVILHAAGSQQAKMIKNMTLEGTTTIERKGNDFYFNLGKRNLQTKKQVNLNGRVHVELPGIISERQPFSIKLGGQKVNYEKNNARQTNFPTGKAKAASNNGRATSSASVAQSAMTTPAAAVAVTNGGVSTAKDSYYNYAAQYLKQGTSQSSVMQNYMLNAAHVEINGSMAKVTIFAKDAKSAQMITNLRLGGQTAHRSGNGFTFTIAKSALSSIITGHVDVSIPGVFSESQPFSLRLTPGFSGTPAGGSASNDASADPMSAALAGGNANMMSAMMNTNAPAANLMTNQAGNNKNNHSKQNNGSQQANNADNIQDADPAAQAANKQKSDMNNTFLSIGGIISAVLGYIGTTLGWALFKG